jgi:hypothetical protein
VAQAERIRRLFSDAGALPRPYSDEQVGYGLDAIVNSAGGDIRVRALGGLRAAGHGAVVHRAEIGRAVSRSPKESCCSPA